MASSEIYDYVVVGGGSSGCVVANRLVTDHGARVLLLEAGPHDWHPLIKMPAGTFIIIQGNTPWLKRIEGEPQQSVSGKTITMAQASVLGGGSSINVMAYIRGSKSDYARWTKAVGGVAWGWEELLPIWRRQEGNQRLKNESHGNDGPFKIGDPPSSPRTSHLFLETMQRLGLPRRDDFNNGDLRGVGFLQTSIHNARRCSAVDAFIKPLAKDPRLTVRTLAKVRRVIFEGKRAVGVEYVQGDKVRTAVAKSEVILTAGAISSPKVLLHSGIGPRKQLEALGIACLVDSPGVGENFQDHCVIYVTYAINGPFGMFGQDKGWRAARNLLQYLLFRTGPLAGNGADIMAFMNHADPSAEPDLQFYCGPIMWPAYAGGAVTHGITLMANLIRPRSRGRLWLRSADPDADVAIDFNWLSDPEDAARLLAGFKFIRKIAATEPLASIIAEERMPGTAAQSDEELMAHIHKTLDTNYHPVGTCKMGSDDDPLAVLTPDLRVRGVEGLRVFDASIMPDIISANTNATAMAIGERGVQLMMRGAQRQAA